MFEFPSVRSFRVLALLLLPAAGLIRAQETINFASVSGRVIDVSGGVIEGAQVTARGTDTNLSNTAETGRDGRFRFPYLQVGPYKITASKQGFSEAARSVTLTVGSSFEFTIPLQVGRAETTIQVNDEAAVLETNRSQIAGTISQTEVNGLPLNGRNFMQLVSLSAGVISGGRASATQRQANYGASFSVGGQRDNTSVVLVDGMEISGQELNNYPLAIPPLDSLAELRVQTANYPAEFGGNSGAVINVVSKRGSNDFHVTLFEFLRNDALDARNFFSPTLIR